MRSGPNSGPVNGKFHAHHDYIPPRWGWRAEGGLPHSQPERRLAGLAQASTADLESMRFVPVLLCPPPGHLPHPGIEPRSPALQVDSLPSDPPGKPCGFQAQSETPALSLYIFWGWGDM